MQCLNRNLSFFVQKPHYTTATMHFRYKLSGNSLTSWKKTSNVWLHLVRTFLNWLESLPVARGLEILTRICYAAFQIYSLTETTSILYLLVSKTLTEEGRLWYHDGGCETWSVLMERQGQIWSPLCLCVLTSTKRRSDLPRSDNAIRFSLGVRGSSRVQFPRTLRWQRICPFSCSSLPF